LIVDSRFTLDRNFTLRYIDGRGIASRFGDIQSGCLTDFAGGDAFIFYMAESR
jgi:hypothetical protein